MDHDPDKGQGRARPESGPLPHPESGQEAFGFIEQAPVAIAVLDRQMRYLAHSRRWSQSHGLGDADLRGRCHYELFDALPKSWHRAHELALSGKSIARTEDRILHPDGREQWLCWEVMPWYDGPGLPRGVMIFTQDITDSKRTEHWLRESEARLRLAAQAAHFGMFDIDLAAGTGHWSTEALALLGLPEAARPDRLEDLRPILDPESLRGMRAALRDALRPGSGGRLVRQLRLPGKRGEDRWLQVHGQVSFAGQGAQRKAQRIRGMILDISDTRRMEQRLSHSERLEAVGRLASAIAHDSNNLLTVVLSNLELALARTHDAEARRMIATAVNAAEVNAGFNRRLLSLSCTRSDRADVVRIGAHLDAMQPLLRHAVGDRIELGIEAGDGLWPVRADPGDLDSALLNLALNARDAMPEGGRLRVTARNASLDAGDAARLGAPAREGAFVCIEMRDSGFGMSKEVAAQAMEPFFTTKPKGRGTGLGLTSTGSFVSRLEGFMTIDSTPGKGTTVALFLPRATGAAEGEADPAATRAEPAHGQGEVVLLVEDNRDVREAGLKRLEVLGYVAIEARDATEALETLARGEPVDLVFSDVSMPGPDSGLSLVRRVRRDFPGLAVLLTTADGTQILHKDSDAALAMVEILPKPHTISDLARALRRALDRRDPSRDRPRP